VLGLRIKLYLRLKLDQIITSLKSEDNVAFKHIYQTHGKSCISKLKNFRNCSLEDAEDLFIVAIMLFREKILNGSITQLTNLESYLYKVCENTYLAKLRVEKTKGKKVSDVEFFYYESDYLSEEEEDFQMNLNEVTKQAWEKLSEKCKDIISFFYIDKLRMDEIAKLMGFSSPDVAKTTKSRCYKQMVTSAKSLTDY